jgi:two-component system cell cycle response regulator CpdR
MRPVFMSGLLLVRHDGRLERAALAVWVPIIFCSDRQPLEETMMRILLAEDDDSLRAFLTRALERAGFEVRACADGDEALHALPEQEWDLLLTDIVMPGADGIEVARQAAVVQPELRIMFITGFAAVALAAKESAPQGAKVLSKPIHLREIVAEVERMMAA